MVFLNLTQTLEEQISEQKLLPSFPKANISPSF